MLPPLQAVLSLSRHIFPETPHFCGYWHSRELCWLLYSSSLSHTSSTKNFARGGVANADALHGRNSGEHLAGWKRVQLSGVLLT